MSVEIKRTLFMMEVMGKMAYCICQVGFLMLGSELGRNSHENMRNARKL